MMDTINTERELAALATRRATQRILDAHHRARRLADARECEDALLEQTDRFLAGVAALLRKFTGAERPAPAPIALPHCGQQADGQRDAA